MLHPLNDASFSDPETASSSGASHIPSFPMSIPSRRGMISRDGCLPPNTMGTSGNVSESLLAREWPSSEFLQNPKNLSSSHCGLKPIDTGQHYGTWRRSETRAAEFCENSPNSVDFQCWKVKFTTEACANSPCPTITMSWIKKVGIANTVDDPTTSQSFKGKFSLRQKQTTYMICDHFRTTWPIRVVQYLLT